MYGKLKIGCQKKFAKKMADDITQKRRVKFGRKLPKMTNLSKVQENNRFVFPLHKLQNSFSTLDLNPRIKPSN